jgi:CspA family cold shock protein
MVVGLVMPNEANGAVADEVVGSLSGVLKWFNPEKGYGFIEVPQRDGDIFLHVKELRKSGIVALNDGASVDFTAMKGKKGLYATDIKVLPGKA